MSLVQLMNLLETTTSVSAQCGLPLMYLDSGGMPEYCDGYGLSFYDDFEIKLNEMINNYAKYKSKMPNYPHNSNKMCEEYYSLFTSLIKNKEKNLRIIQELIFRDIFFY